VLPSASVEAVSLDTIEGQKIAAARLGQQRGMRAVKLREAVAARSAAVAPTVPTALRQNGPAPLQSDEASPELRAAG
jgi:flagellar motor switch protein FliM